MKIKEKVIIVTGGGNGLGREIVLNLLSKGARVAAADINEKSLNETYRLASNNDNLVLQVCDITDRASVDALLNKTLEHFGCVDGIVNNAGIIQPFRKFADLDSVTIERIMNVNLFGMINVTKAFLPELLGRAEAHIVNVSSMGGFLPIAGQTIYGAAKAGVKIISEGLAAELSDTHIKVMTVIPGALFTNIKANSGLGADAGAGTEGHSPDAAFSPVKAAGLIVDAMEYNRKHLYIGKDARSMNILYRLSPDTATNLIYKQIKHKM